MVNNDMCSQIKGNAGESRICAGGKRGEGVCDVRITMTMSWSVKMCFSVTHESVFYGLYQCIQCRIIIADVSFSLPLLCRKTTVVRWFARNMSGKSSSVWAYKGQNAPHHSLRFLLTLRSTLSGYIKCSNFTPVWRGTKILWCENQLHKGLYHSLREEIQLCARKFQDLSSTDHRGEMRETPYEKWPFCYFMAEFSILRRVKKLVIGYHMESAPLRRWRRPSCQP